MRKSRSFSSRQPRRRPLCRLLVMAIMLAMAAAAWLAWYALTPMQSGTIYPVAFSVEKGASLKSAVRDMAQAGVVRHPFAFQLVARFQGAAGQIKAGSYYLEQALTPLALIRKITAGETVLGKLTLIEGWSLVEMRRALDGAANLSHDTTGMSAAELLQAIGATEPHPEGLFFPDTYFFDPGSSDLAILRRAYAAMGERLAVAWEGRAPNLPYREPYQALIMASIIEKETGAPEERPLIASVFINRLRIGMRLQTDPTVIYGLGEQFDGNLRKSDLLADTPYNTYTRAGLPPTPIAMPGEAAIQAALNPAPSRSLYFVAKGQGRHVFSDNLEAHNRAVARYQKGR